MRFRKASTLKKKLRQIIHQGNQGEIEALINDIYLACAEEFREENRAGLDSFLGGLFRRAADKFWRTSVDDAKKEGERAYLSIAKYGVFEGGNLEVVLRYAKEQNPYTDTSQPTLYQAWEDGFMGTYPNTPVG